MKFVRGFTLVELMVTIAVLAIIVAIAAPSMANTIEKQRFQKKERELLTSFAEAKSRAILKRSNVTINLNSADANSDTTINWSHGANVTLTINTLSDTQTLGGYSGNDFIFDQNGLVQSLSQDALITMCNSKINVKKQIVLTRLGAVYTKSEGTC